ncbi:N-acetylmuramoyl-L-alanine amidase [Actinomadura rubrisoli]|uniref:N-acetylmuramoyl-L-alanine amidase n=2 Tax=Actinomadura rubrisoli TaxID=2530368 RepID=A0A4R5C0I6_9ACTN|nr:N-acetylmuramoyl-L-alanine amidase [Actinomadura rubrisoli]
MTRRSLIGGVVGAGLLAVGVPSDNGAMADALAAGGRPVLFTADAPRIHTRADWNAKAPRRPATILKRAPDHIIVHHTDTANSNDRSLTHAYALSRFIQDFHMGTRGWDDTGQQLTISRGGIVMEGRNQTLKAIQSGQHVVGAQVLHHNEHTIGIENEGSYVRKGVPDRLWASLLEVCVWLCTAYDLDPTSAIVGHRDYNKTECPGDVLYARLPELRRSVAARMDGSPKTTQEKPRPVPRDDEIPLFPSFDDFG